MTNNYYNICYEVIVCAIHTNSIVSETLARLLVKIKRVKKCYDQLAAYYYKKRYPYEYNERYIETVITKNHTMVVVKKTEWFYEKNVLQFDSV